MPETRFHPVRMSLADLLGRPYVDAAVEARAALSGESRDELAELATRKVDFFPDALADALADMLEKVGSPVAGALPGADDGATTKMFAAAAKPVRAPLSGLGYYRVGEDGRLYFISKSEHYHAPLGHAFPGYELVAIARRLGIPNATHNNTRGRATRVLERELVAAANGLAPGDAEAIGRVLASDEPTALNRVLNLETGSLVAEAAVKMMLARFYRVEPDSPPPVHAGKTPVFLVLGDFDGGLQANYHGTTVITQMMRGMWPGMYDVAVRAGMMRVVPVRPNSVVELEAAFEKWHGGDTRIAGFIHELVLMNYGGLRLDEQFVRRAYELCRQHEAPTLVDEIQSCLWSPDLFLFHEYGIAPTFVAVGKGFPGGEYPASRLIFSAAMDSLPQFGALVTNGQEELASLAYLVTMRWASANADVTREIGEEYQARLVELARKYPKHIAAIEGSRHMASVYFHELDPARAFVKRLADGGLDISVQSYKASCPPGALTKLPLIADRRAVDMVVSRMDEALGSL